MKNQAHRTTIRMLSFHAYIALGKGLKNAGDAVRLVTNRNCEMLVNSHGLEFWPVDVNIGDIIENERMREVLGVVRGRYRELFTTNIARFRNEHSH